MAERVTTRAEVEAEIEDHDHGGGTLGSENDPVESGYVDELSGIADHIVRSTSELETAFNNLTYGETIYIARPATPYRPSQWLDIDVDGVTVVGQSRFAEDGQPCIKIADGANVGGIRVGNSTAVSDVEVRGVGIHGNDANQDQTIIQLHGIYFVNATHSSVRGCFATRQSPYHVHNDGGSGIAAGHNCSDITITRNWVDDTGDRGIQIAANDVTITENYLSNGFDRSIALDMEEGSGMSYASSHATVSNNVFHDNSEGSFIGLSGGGNNPPHENITITGNVGYGTHRGFIRIRPGSSSVVRENIVIDSNVDIGGSDNHIMTNDGSGTIRNLVISNNQLSGGGGRGISIKSGVESASITGNAVRNPASDGIRSESVGTVIQGNVVRGAGGHGIGTAGNSITITGNYSTNATVNAITSDTGTTNHIITSNHATNSGNYGIAIASNDARDTIVGFNQVHGNTNGGIAQSNDYVTFIGNITQSFVGTLGTNSQKLGNIVR